MAAKGSGAGTYSYINTTASNTSTNYYRLKMTDKDGKFNYSFIVTVNNSSLGDRTFSIFPNPVKTIATILDNMDFVLDTCRLCGGNDDFDL